MNSLFGAGSLSLLRFQERAVMRLSRRLSFPSDYWIATAECDVRAGVLRCDRRVERFRLAGVST